MAYPKKVAKDTRVKDQRNKIALDSTIVRVVVAQLLIQIVQQWVALRDGKHKIMVLYQENNQWWISWTHTDR